jgi:ABC-type sugar transport system ATPase subunit
LLDEPTRGVDIGSKAEIYEIIARQADAVRRVCRQLVSAGTVRPPDWIA